LGASATASIKPTLSIGAIEVRKLTVIIPTHNPCLERFRRTLRGLQAQTLPADQWETLVIDNASTAFPSTADYSDVQPDNLRVIREPRLGLTAARQCGLHATDAEFAVFVDDDNVLAPDYLASALALFAAHPRVGLAGGKLVPHFASEPPAWAREFFPLLALRDLGSAEIISSGLRPVGKLHNECPVYAPVGAGMAMRRAAWQTWLAARATDAGALTDRRGDTLTSSGDNDIVLCAMQSGWEVGYFPQLTLTHLIPAARLDADYLARLNRGIQKSWMQVLALHDACPWPPLSATGVALRKSKAWFVYHPWTSPAAHVRYHGACGHFEGRLRR
jgi:glycosyltransferase involved in cell wall biosynthesis